MKLEAAIKEEQILRRSGGGGGGEATGNGIPIEPLRRLSCVRAAAWPTFHP